MKQPETNKYQDIIHLSRPRSQRHPPMSAHDRAGQFSPFAALTGFEAAIAETQRLTDSRIILDTYNRQMLFTDGSAIPLEEIFSISLL